MAKGIKHYINRIKSGRLKELASDMKWIYGYGKKHILSIIIYTALGLSGVIVSLIGSLVSRDLVNIITGHQPGALMFTFIMMIVVQLVSMAIGNISQYISTVINLKVDNTIKSDIYSKIITTEWEELTRFHSGDLLTRWSSDASVVSNGILSMIPNAIMYIFRFGSALWLVLREDPSFAIFAVISAPVTLIASRQSMRRMRKSGMGNLEANTRMSSFIQESFSNTQLVKAFDMIPVYLDRLKECQSDLTNAKLRYQRFSIFNVILTTIISMIVTYSTYGWGVYKVWNGYIDYGTMTMFISLSTSLSGSIQNLISLIPSTIALSNSAKRLMDIDSLPKEDYSMREEVAEFANKHLESGIGLSVRDAAFTYKNGTDVFAHVSFDAHPHEAIALVGPSGEGKTTMLRLILSIISPGEGTGYVCPGGKTPELTDECLQLSASTRQLFAYVPQGNTMFSGTIASNMRNVKGDATDEEIIDALQKACAWDFVSKLPDGINSYIQEHGGGFSEGQAQRLSIARAILRRSPILLLDEATSALDVATERNVLRNIMSDSYPRTTVVTTHRPSVLTVCNRVYAIRNHGCDLMTTSEINDMIKGY